MENTCKHQVDTQIGEAEGGKGNLYLLGSSSPTVGRLNNVIGGLLSARHSWGECAYEPFHSEEKNYRIGGQQPISEHHELTSDNNPGKVADTRASREPPSVPLMDMENGPETFCTVSAADSANDPIYTLALTLSRVYKNCWWGSLGRWLWAVFRTFIITIGVAVATMVFIWSLFPLNTSCGYHTRKRVTNTAPAEGNSTLRINQLQVMGTHNSYHLSAPLGPDVWMYQFPSLTTQLDQGIRHLELDVHYDFKTGRWFVYHLSIIDSHSLCNCLSSCLKEIRDWSDANPTHHILFIELEIKIIGDFLKICQLGTGSIDKPAFRRLQDEVLSQFPRGHIMAPSEVRQGDLSLSDSVRGEGGFWPLVDDTRGMVVFVLDIYTRNLGCRDSLRQALPIWDSIFFERTPVEEAWDSPYSAFAETHPGASHLTSALVDLGLIVRLRVSDDMLIPWGDRGPLPSIDSMNMSDINSTEGDYSQTMTNKGLSNVFNGTMLDHQYWSIAYTTAQLVVSDNFQQLIGSPTPESSMSSLLKESDLNKTDTVSSSPSLFSSCSSRCSPFVAREDCMLIGFC